MRGGEGQGDLSVGAEVSVCGHDGENDCWTLLRVLALRDLKGVRDGWEVWGVVVVVQYGDVELSCGCQTVRDLIHRHYLNTDAENNKNSAELTDMICLI